MNEKFIRILINNLICSGVPMNMALADILENSLDDYQLILESFEEGEENEDENK